MALSKTIPIDQARVGDIATVTMGQTVMRGPLVRRDGELMLDGTRWTLDGVERNSMPTSITLEREVPDLPTEPGSIIRAKAHGERHVLVLTADRDGSPWWSPTRHPGTRYVETSAIDLSTVELATITWGAEA